jgi:hypothetical protein
MKIKNSFQQPLTFIFSIDERRSFKKVRVDGPTRIQTTNHNAMVVYRSAGDKRDENIFSSPIMGMNPTFYLPFGEVANGSGNSLIMGAMYREHFFQVIVNKEKFKSRIITLGDIYKVLQGQYYDEKVKYITLAKLQENHSTRQIIGLYVKLKITFQKNKECDTVEEEHGIAFGRYITLAEKTHESEMRQKMKDISERDITIESLKRDLDVITLQADQLQKENKALLKSNEKYSSTFATYKTLLEEQADEIKVYRQSIRKMSQAIKRQTDTGIKALSYCRKKTYHVDGIKVKLHQKYLDPCDKQSEELVCVSDKENPGANDSFLYSSDESEAPSSDDSQDFDSESCVTKMRPFILSAIESDIGKVYRSTDRDHDGSSSLAESKESGEVNQGHQVVRLTPCNE